ncbi:hypothetical protein NQ318_003518, partial [Aromia moschata]
MNSVDFLLTNKDITYEVRTEIKRVLGKVDIRQQLDSAYRENIRRHNENVDKNRHILNQIITCIKFLLTIRTGELTASTNNDEATDACGRSVANFLIGALKSDTASDSHPNLPWETCLNTDVVV